MYRNPPEHPGTFRGTGNATDTSDVTLLTAPGAGEAWMVTSIIIYNSHASTTTGVQMKSTGMTWGPIPAPFAGGSINHFPKPLPFPENAPVQFACLGSVSTVYVSIIAYKTQAKLT